MTCRRYRGPIPPLDPKGGPDQATSSRQQIIIYHKEQETQAPKGQKTIDERQQETIDQDDQETIDEEDQGTRRSEENKAVTLFRRTRGSK